MLYRAGITRRIEKKSLMVSRAVTNMLASIDYPLNKKDDSIFFFVNSAAIPSCRSSFVVKMHS